MTKVWISIGQAYPRKDATRLIRAQTIPLEMCLTCLMCYPSNQNVPHWSGELLGLAKRLRRYTNIKKDPEVAELFYRLVWEEPFETPRQILIMRNDAVYNMNDLQPEIEPTVESVKVVVERLIALVLGSDTITADRIERCLKG